MTKHIFEEILIQQLKQQTFDVANIYFVNGRQCD